MYINIHVYTSTIIFIQFAYDKCCEHHWQGGRPREEDDLMAWTFREFLDDPEHDPEMLSLFPMTKVCETYGK